MTTYLDDAGRIWETTELRLNDRIETSRLRSRTYYAIDLRGDIVNAWKPSRERAWMECAALLLFGMTIFALAVFVGIGISRIIGEAIVNAWRNWGNR